MPRFFKSKKKVEDSNKDLIDILKSVNTEIDDLKSQYGNSILASIISDEGLYVECLKSGDTATNNKFWHINGNSFTYNRFTMHKYGTGINNRISIDVEYESYEKEMTIRDMNLSSKGVSTKLGDEYKNIIKRYLIQKILSERIEHLENTKSSFITIKNIIGDSAVRESKIEQILK